MVDIPTIEPFQFIRGTAFSERVQLANKLNEVIDALNQIGTIDDLQTQIDAINSEISEIHAALLNTNSDVSALSNQVNALISEVNGLLKEVISEVALDSPGYGQVRVKLIHEDETETVSNVLQIPVIQDGGITLISGTTDRSFKLQYVTTDGVTHTTNDFVIPEGGGTDITVTSVSIEQGDTSNSFKFEIGLSDGSSIQSNSYPFPPGTELTPATTSQLGGIKVGTHLSVTADGTLSVDMTTIGTAAAAPTVMWTADTSKVTMHFDSLVGTEYTEDIPTAASGGAGTIDAAAYQKLQNVPAPDTIATDAEISDLQEQITGLKLSNDTICVCSGIDNSVYGILEVDPSLFTSISPTSMYGTISSSDIGVNPTNGYLQINNIVLKTTQVLTLGLIPSSGSTVNGKINAKTKINLNLNATSVDCYYKFVSIKDGVVILDSPNPMWVKFYNVRVEYAPTKEGLTTDIIAKYEGTTIIGYTDFASRVAHDSSQLFARNIYNFVTLMLKDSKIDLSDEIVQSTLIK